MDGGADGGGRQQQRRVGIENAPAVRRSDPHQAAVWPGNDGGQATIFMRAHYDMTLPRNNKEPTHVPLREGAEITMPSRSFG